MKTIRFLNLGLLEENFSNRQAHSVSNPGQTERSPVFRRVETAGSLRVSRHLSPLIEMG
jgi:hypothetical protein